MFCKVCWHLQRNRYFLTRTTFNNTLTPTLSCSNEAATVTNSKGAEEVVIPKRKQRDKFSILRALSSTVERDTNAPHYKYIDDPFLMPTSTLQKRTHALSDASGRKAARWFLETEAESFKVFDSDEPKIKAFTTPKTDYTITETSEAALKERINMRRVNDAFLMYKNLKSEGVEISQETANELLDLLSVYNSDDPGLVLTPGEQYFSRDVVHDESYHKIRKTWKSKGAADKVFDELPEKNARSYNTIIRGMCKYYETDGARDLFREALTKGHPVDLVTFNSMLSIASFFSDDYESKWADIMDLLSQMNALSVRPDIHTFNAVLFGLYKIPRWRQSKQMVMSVLQEMKALDIEPSLTSMYYVLKIFHKEDNSQEDMIYQVIKYMKGRHYTLQDITDFDFFRQAMLTCFISFKDIELAQSIDEVLNFGDNKALLGGDSFRETQYYTLMFRLIASVETIEKTMEFYDKFTPHIWVPIPVAMEELLEAIDLHDGFQYMPQIWSDMIMFGYTQRENLVGIALKIMAKKKQDEELQSYFASIVDGLKEVTDENKQRRTRIRPFQFTGDIMGNMIDIYCWSEQFNKAWEIYEMVKSGKDSLGAPPSERSLMTLCGACIEAGHTDKTMDCLVAMSNWGYKNGKTLVEKAKEKLTLSDFQKQQTESMF